MKITNKNAFRDYEILDKLEAGIVLLGGEVKSIKNNRLDLKGSYIKFTNNTPLLINAQVPAYKFADNQDYDPKRSRQLLLNKKEIIRLKTKITANSNLTIIPLSCYPKKGKIKLEIGLAKGKKSWQKKRVEKERQEKRRQEKELKNY